VQGPQLAVVVPTYGQEPLRRDSSLLEGQMGEVSGLAGLRDMGGGVATRASVGVVIPAKDRARNLERVFDTTPDWVDEIVLVDGHSADDTIAVALELNPAVKIIRQQRQ
jgi:hypothetical protein